VGSVVTARCERSASDSQTPLCFFHRCHPTGYKAAGDVAALQQLAAQHGMGCSVVDLVPIDGTGGRRGQEEEEAPVSSSKIRELLAEGRVDTAAKLMGRPYRLVAAVSFGPQGEEQRTPLGSTSGAGAAPGGATPSGSDDEGDGHDRRGQVVVSTSSMDGHESDSVPLQLRDGGRMAFIGGDGLLNAPPGLGRYRASLALHVGATPADELLHLEAAHASAGSGGNGSGGAHSPPPLDCIAVASMEIELCRGGLLLPAGPLLQAMAGGGALKGGQALVVLDFQQRVD
jgi:hypothetical protein